jgi:hypothetical protein
MSSGLKNEWFGVIWGSAYLGAKLETLQLFLCVVCNLLCLVSYSLAPAQCWEPICWWQWHLPQLELGQRDAVDSRQVSWTGVFCQSHHFCDTLAIVIAQLPLGILPVWSISMSWKIQKLMTTKQNKTTPSMRVSPPRTFPNQTSKDSSKNCIWLNRSGVLEYIAAHLSISTYTGTSRLCMLVS